MKRVLGVYTFLLSLRWTIQIDDLDDRFIVSKCANLYKCVVVEDKSVRCNDLNLTDVPQCMENVESLDMSGNRLLIVGLPNFPDQYRNLSKLILRNTLLKVIVENAFLNLYNLRELDLSENLLRNVPPFLFANNELLERLNLSVNRIRRLYVGQFALPRLQTLDMSNGVLEYVDDAAFAKLPALQWLNLRDNRLKTLSLDNDVPSFFGGGNPWNCDCGFLMLAKRVNETTDKNFTCWDTGTERSRRLWTTLSLVESDCKEKLESLKTAKRADENGKTKTSMTLILDVYEKVLAGIAILVILCFCCCWCGDYNEEERDRRMKKTEISSMVRDGTDSSNQLVTDV